MQALDVYTISAGPVLPTGIGNTAAMAAKTPSAQAVRSREEKEVLDQFAGVVSESLSVKHGY